VDSFDKELNQLFMRTYRSINKVEETMLQTMSNGSLSISEMHIIECIGRDRKNGVTVSDIAQDMEITLPSATIAVKKLEKKGYVTKARDTEDGRRVYVQLTEHGRKAEVAHRYFHRKMLKAVSKMIREEDRPVLLNAVRALNDFFETTVRETSQPSGEQGGMES